MVKAAYQIPTPIETLQEGLPLSDTCSVPEAAACARASLQAAVPGARAAEAILAQVDQNVFKMSLHMPSNMPCMLPRLVPRRSGPACSDWAARL